MPEKTVLYEDDIYEAILGHLTAALKELVDMQTSCMCEGTLEDALATKGVKTLAQAVSSVSGARAVAKLKMSERY